MLCTDTRVALCRQSTYNDGSLDPSISRLLAAQFSPATCRSSSVLIKPNLITATNGRLACTNGRVILAAVSFFKELGARVTVGDSPAFGSAESVLRRIGVLQDLERLDIRVAEFRQYIPTKLPSGQLAQIARPVLECDHLINLPKVKAHAQMRVTLAVKNYFGCISGLRKPWWHMVHGGPGGRFADLLVELLSVLPAGYSLVDGIEAMHVTGPIHGEPFPLGILAAGENPLAVDTAILAVLGVDRQSSPLWLAAQQQNLPGTALEHLLCTHDAPSSLHAQGFVVPEELMPVRFNPFRFVKSTLQRLVHSRNR